MERLLIIGLYFFMSISLSACSLDASIMAIGGGETSLFGKLNVGEVISSSIQYEQTNVRHFMVQASVGAMTENTYQVSKIRGYRVYQGVQGQIISEDIK